MRTRRALFVVSVVSVVAMMTVGAWADSLAIDFESYTTGTIDGQDGWSSDGAAGSGCAVYDHAVTSNVAQPYSYPSFGSKSLRISNAVTSGCFGDQTYSKSLVDEAGEVDGVSDGFSGGTRKRHFEAEWDFASTVPTAEQPGLSTVVSPDRGDGARMSWVQMADTPTGVDINFNDFQGATVIDGSCTHGDFVQTNIATGLDRSVPHHIKITMDFADGPGNDLVNVYVDNALAHTGTSWEDFFRECQPPGSRTVDSVLFRTAGTAAPGTAGNGWLFDNLRLLSSATSTSLTATPAIARLLPGVNLYLFDLTAKLTSPTGPVAGKIINFKVGSSVICTGVTNGAGLAQCNGFMSAVDIVLGLGYTASFAGDAGYGSSSAHGPLLSVGGTPVP